VVHATNVFPSDFTTNLDRYTPRRQRPTSSLLGMVTAERGGGAMSNGPIPQSLDEVRDDVVERLQARSLEIVKAIHACILEAVPDPIEGLGADYQAGVLAAIAAIVEYSLEGIRRGPGWSAPIPKAAAIQVRRAARAGVSVGTVVRRYLAGHGCLGQFIVQEVEDIGLSSHGPTLHHLHRTQEVLLQHLTAAIEHEYNHECERARSPEQRCIKLVRRLLVEDVDLAELKELDYEVLCSWHLGVIAPGVEGGETLRRLETAPGRKLLFVPGDDGTVSAWLGGHAKVTVAEFKRLVSVNGPPGAPLAVGEPGHGLHGWRQTHEEAQVALLIARHEPRGLTRCADALPVVGALQSEAIIRMYEKTYILPLNNLHKGGQPARRSLLAYFKHGRNASSAGGAINVTGRTVQNHLNDVRKVLDAPLNLTGLEIALRLEELGYMADAEDPPYYPVSGPSPPG
jgi:hypothetical protein